MGKYKSHNIWISASVALVLATSAFADEVEYKLTASYYNVGNSDAGDVNLRANSGNHTAWLGQYQDDEGFRQTRAGYEYKQNSALLRVTWSAQLATRGFAGGSVTAEVGGDTYAIAGFGRTNLHPYYNLNFDPNDALTAGIGTRAVQNLELALFRVWDDRLDTHQQVTHASARYKLPDEQRLTFDVSYKTGYGDAGYQKGYGLTATYDIHQYFIRLAAEQHANFEPDTMTRLSIGMRF